MKICYISIILIAELIPKDLEKELRNVYVCTCELLRHFWRSFPPTTPQLEEKAIRMHEALHRFHSAKLKPFEVNFFKVLKFLKFYMFYIYVYLYIDFCDFYVLNIYFSRIVFNETFLLLVNI